MRLFHRIRKDYYRGMSEEDKQKWLDDIAAQKEEQASKVIQEKLYVNPSCRQSIAEVWDSRACVEMPASALVSVCRDDLATAQEQMDLVRKARRFEVEVEREREAARLRHLAELERQRADKRAR